jgi:hypothetical protein
MARCHGGGGGGRRSGRGDSGNNSGGSDRGSGGNKGSGKTKGSGVTEGAVATQTSVAWRLTAVYVESTYVFLQIHFLRSILRRHHKDRILMSFLPRFRRSKRATGTEKTGIRRISAGMEWF